MILLRSGLYQETISLRSKLVILIQPHWLMAMGMSSKAFHAEAKKLIKIKDTK